MIIKKNDDLFQVYSAPHALIAMAFSIASVCPGLSRSYLKQWIYITMHFAYNNQFPRTMCMFIVSVVCVCILTQFSFFRTPIMA